MLYVGSQKFGEFNLVELGLDRETVLRSPVYDIERRNPNETWLGCSNIRFLQVEYLCSLSPLRSNITRFPSFYFRCCFS